MYKNSKDYTDKVISKFPHMYNREPGSNNYFLLELYLEEIRQISQSIYDLLKSLNIMTATGYTLDKFGISFNLERAANENNKNYRQRILAEIYKNLKNATFETILGVLKIIIENHEQNIFIYKEGIRRTSKNDIDINVKNGSYNGNYNNQYFEIKGGTIYIILNKKLPENLRKSVLNTLLEIRAKGVEITVDFKYKIQTANYISGGARVGTQSIIHITDSFYDEIMQTKSYEAGLARINVIAHGGVR